MELAMETWGRPGIPPSPGGSPGVPGGGMPGGMPGTLPAAACCCNGSEILYALFSKIA